MLNRFFFIVLIFIFSSCDMNNEAVPISDLGQDNLENTLFSLNLETSDTLHKLNPIGTSSLLYSGPINDSDYVYTLLSIDKEIFQNYDLCNADSISYEDLNLVIDVIKEYEINFDIQDDINSSINQTDDTWNPTFLAYWIDFSDLKDIDGFNFLNQDWEESDFKIFDNVDFNSLIETFESDLSKKLSVNKYLGKYYINLSDQIIDINEDCLEEEIESDCVDNGKCIWSNQGCLSLLSIELFMNHSVLTSHE